MKIWVDADACPRPVKDILFRAGKRTGVSITLVANQFIFTPLDANIDLIRVEAGLDAADYKILELCMKNDLVVTADIPLASAAVKKGSFALNPRGKMYDSNNIGDALAMRDLMDDLRAGALGEYASGPDNFTSKDSASFANSLDKFITKSIG